MIVGIDAHNIRGNGGSVIHLKELLSNAEPERDNFTRLIVWIDNTTYSKLPQKSFIKYIPLKQKSQIQSLIWSRLKLETELKKNNCDILFVPGGIYLGKFKPFIVLAQDMLPFDEIGQSFYKGTLFYYILKIKKALMLYTIRRAKGIIYVSKVIQSKIEKYLKKEQEKGIVIHHGVNEIFAAKRTRKFMEDNVLRLVTFSGHSLHKNLIPICKEVSELRNSGYVVELKIIGPVAKYGTNELLKLLSKLEPKGEFIKLFTDEKYEDLPNHMNNSDIFIAPSLCESFGMPFKEAIVNQIPIIYHKLDSFEEILTDFGEMPNIKKYTNINDEFKEQIILTLKNGKSNRLKNIDERHTWQYTDVKTFNYFKKILIK